MMSKDSLKLVKIRCLTMILLLFVTCSTGLLGQEVATPQVVFGNYSTTRFDDIELTIDVNGRVQYGSYRGQVLPENIDFFYEAGLYTALIYQGFIFVDMMIQSGWGVLQYSMLELLDGTDQVLYLDMSNSPGSIEAALGFDSHIILLYPGALKVYDIVNRKWDIDEVWNPRESSSWEEYLSSYYIIENRLYISKNNGDILVFEI